MPTTPSPTFNALVSTAEAASLIRSGAFLCLAGSAEALAQLPAGDWIAGTIPYFLSEAGGTKTLDRIFVTRFPEDWRVTIAHYAADRIDQIVPNTPDDGFSFVITPCGCPALDRFALSNIA